MELWTAFLIGLAGSLHCIGMCGPIAISLPTGENPLPAYVTGRVLYNVGRILTYSLMGLACGFVGRTILMAGYQQWLSIALGVVILLAVFLPSKYAVKLTGAGWHSRQVGRLKKIWRHFFSKSTIGSLFVVGILNGFLPCGLVYVALAGSLATGAALKGAAYMAVFGFGTFPVMLAMSLFGTMIGMGLRKNLRRLLSVGGVILACLFILRGLSLGIPLISPKMEQNAQGQTEVKCCHEGSQETNTTGP